MPNHCYQSVHLQGPRSMVQELYYQLTEHDRFCDVVIPTSLALFSEDHPAKEDGQLIPVWYDWRCDHWGTKWDVADVEIVEDVAVSDDGRTAWFAFRCWTAWAPPVPVWDKLHSMGIAVEAEYQDEGVMFEGEYKDGEDSCWDMLEEEEA